MCNHLTGDPRITASLSSESVRWLIKLKLHVNHLAEQLVKAWLPTKESTMDESPALAEPVDGWRRVWGGALVEAWKAAGCLSAAHAKIKWLGSTKQSLIMGQPGIGNARQHNFVTKFSLLNSQLIYCHHGQMEIRCKLPTMVELDFKCWNPKQAPSCQVHKYPWLCNPHKFPCRDFLIQILSTTITRISLNLALQKHPRSKNPKVK